MENKENLTLNDLAEGAVTPEQSPEPETKPTNMAAMSQNVKLDSANVTEIDPSSFGTSASKPLPENVHTGNQMIDDAINSMDSAIERNAVTNAQTFQALKDAEEERLFDEDEEETTNTQINDQQLQEAISKSMEGDYMSNDEINQATFNLKNRIMKTPPPTEQPTPVNMHDTSADAIAAKVEAYNAINTVEEKENQTKAPVMTPTQNIPIIDGLDNDFKDDDEDTTNPDPDRSNKPTNINSIAAGIDDDDMKYLEDDEDSDIDQEQTEKEIKEKIRIEMKQNFKPISDDDKIDFSNFTISKKPLSAAKVISHIQNTPAHTADTVLFTEKRPVRMSALDPMEITKLDPDLVRRSNYTQIIIDRLHLIYDHIIDPNKPATFEAWTKVTYEDTYDDYFFGLYKATFGRSNIITYSCRDEECNNIFMKSRDIDDMIKFRNDDIKKEYYNILHSGNINGSKDTYEASLLQLSAEYAATLKKPTFYSSYIEPSYLNEEFINKYSDIMNMISYIDDIYIIDRANGELIKIDTKPVPRDPGKTVRRKVKTYAQILKSLTSDQLQYLDIITDKFESSVIDNEGNRVDNIVYVYPEDKCEKCGKVIPETKENPANMLFTRHQLGLMSRI